MQEDLIKLAIVKGYNKFNPDWFKNNQVNSDTWYLELCLLEKWLREVHKFHIEICNTNPGTKVEFKFSMEELGKSDSDKSKKYIRLGSKGTFETYEEALEVGLQRALNLI